MRRNVFLFLSLLLFVSCQPTEEETHKPIPYALPQPLFFPTTTNIPEDNPMTEEGVALGKLLFNDTHASTTNGRHVTCCASCHRSEYGFEFGPEGSLQNLGTHHTMLPLVNPAWNTTGFGWNGAVASLEDMVYAAFTDPAEIDADTGRVVQYLQQSDNYPDLFRKAFGTEKIQFGLVQKAIAQYVRTLVSSNSKFDRYLQGKEQLSQDELNGYLLFVTEDGADCFHCHGGGVNALFTTNLFYNNGLDSEFHDPQDRFAVTSDPADRGAYKAPSLRNIALTAPYMHDGRFNTLNEVIDFYSDSVKYSELIHPLMHHVMQGGVRLTTQEKEQLKAFLNTLTDEDFVDTHQQKRP